jgi:Dyp-type peroxidase family
MVGATVSADAEFFMSDAVTVPLDDVQGIILRGYELLDEATFLLLTIDDAAAARTWLRNIVGRLTSARAKPDQEAINLAFTYRGLLKLGLPEDAAGAFSREFQEGMDTEHRNRVLGDTGNEQDPNDQLTSQAPKYWLWGNRSEAPNNHLLLMIYANGAATHRALCSSLKAELAGSGLRVLREFDTKLLEGRKEHFGFRDGIAQPSVAGVIKNDVPSPADAISTGEFLLGYPNEYGKFPPSPTVIRAVDNAPVDWGCNGSYLVFRQLEQNVHAFWQYIDQAAAQPNQTAEERHAARVLWAAKMVGRWPNGAPLALTDNADQQQMTDEDKFGFGRDDPLGTRTPIGAHIRRSNPRDSLEPGPGGKGRLTPEESQRVTRLHRIMRRGRDYGPPLAPSMDAADLVSAADDNEKRGLLFLCFNANIARQFEFIQQTWINNPKFGGLYGDTDPLMGQRHPGELNQPADTFTIQAEPVRRRCLKLPQFVRMRGGGYFFMPGLEAIKHLAQLPAHLPPAAPLPEAEETIPPKESEFVARLVEMLRAKVQRDYPTGLVRRDAHAKHHGCVSAVFQVERDLPPELRVGIFREPKTYKAWIRFSNQDGVPRSDNQKDIRGMAIKLLGVPGPKLLDDERDAPTQDFVLISTNRFVTKDVEEFYHLVDATIRGTFSLVWFLINPFNSHLRVMRNLWKSMLRFDNPLHIRYWSTTPYLLGRRAVKYSARPVAAKVGPIPRNPGPDFLREAMKESLSRAEACFDFLVQCQVDQVQTPIEDPGTPWDESVAPFRKVATIRIPMQSFDAPEQMAFGENLSFTPWHSLPEHRPLGGINRARKVAYRAISKFRHESNGIPRIEPTD